MLLLLENVEVSEGELAAWEESGVGVASVVEGERVVEEALESEVKD